VASVPCIASVGLHRAFMPEIEGSCKPYMRARCVASYNVAVKIFVSHNARDKDTALVL
jgi:hypothetical protein